MLDTEARFLWNKHKLYWYVIPVFELQISNIDSSVRVMGNLLLLIIKKIFPLLIAYCFIYFSQNASTLMDRKI